MSGRLVILPHKSWNVWNQDNREKVAKDERLHREAEEAKAAKEKQLLQEQNLELLRDGEFGTKTDKSSSSSENVQAFRLFEDLEKQHFDRIGNEDYLKEKYQKEQLQKKRDGIADWALGEGSVDISKVRPWYETLGASSSASGGKSLDPGRESNRKEKADPMGAILKPNTYEYQPKIKIEGTADSKVPKFEFLASSGVVFDSIESKEDDKDSDSSHTRTDRKKARKHHHKERKSKKRINSDESDEEKKNRKRKRTAEHGDASNGTAPVDPWAELRTKRLEREAIERKRTAALLASVDIYGTGPSSESRGYGQQYHPHLAKNKRR
jgi:hypothetical protein